jgi:hypothetical protein
MATPKSPSTAKAKRDWDPRFGPPGKSYGGRR